MRTPFRDYPMQLREYYVQRLRATYAERAQKLAAARTGKQAAQHCAGVRRALKRCFGPLPSRTPLRPKVIRAIDWGPCRIEHVLYESRPGFLVSANLYLPRESTGEPLPGVLFTCGHSHDGKAYSLYAGACLRLAREGYAVLAYDPINQGERDIYSSLRTRNRPTRDQPCRGHNLLGKQLSACGDWFGAWRLWDGMRGVDYMLTRPEIDPGRLAVTGQSGGGTMSAYLWAMDRRFKAVASSCWTTSYLLDIENGMPADNEQYAPGLLAAGLDKIDYFMARAGEPVLLLGQEQDFFDDRGLRAGVRELKRMHKLMGGNPAFCQLSIDTQEHALSVTAQRALVRFFNRVFLDRKTEQHTGPADAPGEPVLQVTPGCDVNSAGSTPAYKLAASLGRRATAGRNRARPKQLPRLVRRVLRVPGRIGTPHHRRLFHTGTALADTKRRVFRFGVETEPGIVCVLRRVCADGKPFRMAPAESIRLYLPNLCSQSEQERIARRNRDFWILDVRGLGEGSPSPDDWSSVYGQEYMHSGHALMYGETLLGGRVFDVLSAVALLRAEGAKHVHLDGRGQGAVLALVAGVLDPGIDTVSSRRAPESILAMVQTPLTWWPDVNFPHGVLHHFDLPDLRRALGKRLAENTFADSSRFTP